MLLKWKCMYIQDIQVYDNTQYNECTRVQNTPPHVHMRARILKSSHATEMCVTGSIWKICRQKMEIKEKEARCLTLSHIPGSV